MTLAGVLFVLVSAGACGPADRPIVTEILYDAAGDDTGREFVELFNPSSTPFPLAGFRLEVGDGSGPGRWSTRWSAGVGDTVPASGRFVVGGALVAPPPDAIASLELQNGPDAIRAVWPDGAREVVGYGGHEFSEYACGEPATDGPSGQSLARIPDDSNQGSNALDFRPSSPSAGRANQATRDAAIAPNSLVLHPEQPQPGSIAELAALVINAGREPFASGEPAVHFERIEGSIFEPIGRESLSFALAPGETALVRIVWPTGAAGRKAVRARAELAGDQASENDADTLGVRVGRGPLELTEIQFHPAGGEGEWIELRNRDPEAFDASGLRLSDRTGTQGIVRGASMPIPPESLVVVAQDPASLLAVHPGLDPSRIWQVSPWPSLNNSDGADGTADEIVLREPDGLLIERMSYSSQGVPPGATLERRENVWLPSPQPGGGPLAPPAQRPALSQVFRVTPRRLAPSSPEALLEWSLPWPLARVSIEVYDLEGRRLARPVSDRLSPGRGVLPWRPDTLPPGLYLVSLRARSPSGPQELHQEVAVRVAGAAR